MEILSIAQRHPGLSPPACDLDVGFTHLPTAHRFEPGDLSYTRYEWGKLDHRTVQGGMVYAPAAVVHDFLQTGQASISRAAQWAIAASGSWIDFERSHIADGSFFFRGVQLLRENVEGLTPVKIRQLRNPPAAESNPGSIPQLIDVVPSLIINSNLQMTRALSSMAFVQCSGRDGQTIVRTGAASAVYFEMT